MSTPIQLDDVGGFAFEDDEFLDRLSGLLNSIVGDCTDALQWSLDSDKTFTNLRHSFYNIQRLCHDAGMVRGNPLGLVNIVEHDDTTSLKPSSVNQDLSISLSALERTESRRTIADTAGLDHSAEQSAMASMRPPTLHQHHVPLSTRDDIIEVEITDILISTQEEIQRWKHDFRIETMQQEARQHDLNREHMEQIQALQTELSDSQRQVAHLMRELSATNAKVDALQAWTTTSQKAMEVTLKEHSQYWKAICNDLVIEKRMMATRLAEERGKYYSLREHIDMHDQSRTTAPTTPTMTASLRGKVRHTASNQEEQTSSVVASDKDNDEQVLPAESPQQSSTRLSSKRGSTDKLLSSIEQELRRTASTSARIDAVHPVTAAAHSTFRQYYLAKKGNAVDNIRLT